MKKIQLNKQMKLFLASGIILAFGASAITYQAQRTSKQKKAESTLLTKQKTHYASLLEEATRLFSSEKQEFLIKDLTDEQVTTLQKKYETLVTTEKQASLRYDLDEEKERDLVKKETKECLDQLALKLEEQTDINNCFEKEVLNGEEYLENVGIKENLKAEELKEFTVNEESEDAFDKAMNKLVKNATAQQQDHADAIKKTDLLYEKDKVSEKATTKTFNEAYAATDKVITQTLKKKLIDKLHKVEDELENRAKEATAKKEKEEAKKIATNNEANTESNTTANDNIAQTGNTSNQTSNNQGTSSNSGNGGSSNSGGTSNGGSSSNGNSGGNGSSNTGGNNGNSGNTGGGSTGGGNTTEPTQPQQPLGGPGNSGMKFGSMNEAYSWASQVTGDPNSQWLGKQVHIYPVYYPDGTEAFWTVNFS